MDCVAIIPARFGSTRFPGKPLADLCGRPLVAHVAERCARLTAVRRVIVATDDERIVAAARAAGAEAVLTDPGLASGTDRVAAVAADLEAEIVVNVQGDEPQVPVEELDAALAQFAESGHDYGTLRAPLRQERDLWDPNTVKVVVDASGSALYFSRAPVPLPRAQLEPGAEGRVLRFGASPSLPGPYWLHVGVYMYRTPALLRWSRMPPSPLETHERLEQLRVLEAGARMQTYEVTEALPGVDTPEDLDRVRRALGDIATVESEP